MNSRNGIYNVVRCCGAGLFILFIHACGVKKSSVITEPSTPQTTVVTKDIDAKDYLNNYIRYKTFSGNSETEVNMPNFNQSFDLNLKSIYADKIFGQIKAGAFGLTAELAQLYTNKDSIIVLDKFNTTYYHLDWSQSQTFLRIQLDHEMFQNIIVGNPPIISTQYERFDYTDSTVSVEQQIGSDFQRLVYDRQSMHLHQIIYIPGQSDYKLVITLSDYRIHAPTLIRFPAQQRWHIQQPQGITQVYIAYNQVEFNTPLDIKFSIPFRFTKSELR